MASPAHGFYCFEVLSASFEHREAPPLRRVLDLYAKYTTRVGPHATRGSGGDGDTDGVDIEGSTADSDDEAEQPGEDDEASRREEAERIERRQSTGGNGNDNSSGSGKGGLLHPSISRLQTSTSSSRSSSTSSPSTVSANSSNTQLTHASSATSVSVPRPSYAAQLSATESYPLFVTWNTLSRSGHKSLRGCIGTFEALPLASGLSTYALTSAFDDTRFSPIPASLLPALSCSLTLLSDFEPCQGPLDWVLGRHGLRISFTYRSRRHGATYLPDVATEQGWTKEETVESLMKKAGWDGGSGPGVARRLLRGTVRASDGAATKPWDDVNDFKAVRYTGLKSSATYDEWQAWRGWLQGQGEVLR